MAQIDDLPPLRDVIRRHGLSAKKSLGQNFLLDLNLTTRIARAAEPLDNITVVEVGPGPGGLTRALLALGAPRLIQARSISAPATRCASIWTNISDRNAHAWSPTSPTISPPRCW